jgi:hypothetical protein
MHLKRFKALEGKRSKLNTLINYPITNLDLTRYISGPPRGNPADYDLYAVINHHGNLTSGHYTSICKNNMDNKWYEFDDDSLKLLQPQDVVVETGYLLFYQRKSSKIASGRHWSLRMPKVQKALDEARLNPVKNLSLDETTDQDGLLDNEEEKVKQEIMSTIARAAVREVRGNITRHNSTPGFKIETESYSDVEGYTPSFKSRAAASTGALLGKCFNVLASVY